MALTEKQKEDLAARKAINEAKRAKKPATKVVKKKQDVVEPSSESITDVLEKEATNVLPEGENVSTASTDSLELKYKVYYDHIAYEKQQSIEELALYWDIEEVTGNFFRLFTKEQLLEFFGGSEFAQTYIKNLELVPNDVGLEEVEDKDTHLTYDPEKVILEWADGTKVEGFSEESVISLEIEPNCSIDFTNGRSKPAVSTLIGGYNTQEGTYFDKLMREVVYILTLGGKFDRTVAPRFSSLPLSCKMKVPVEKYMDYVNRVGYPDYNSDKEAYKVSLSAPDFRVLINSLEKHIELGWEIDAKQACLHKGRYVVPFRLRFPVENGAGLHCKLRTPLKYTVEELREMGWSQVKGIAKVHGIEDSNHNAVISQLMTIMENIDG